MSILFKDWIIQNTDPIIARQYDNLSRSLAVTGDLPEGWEWAMKVHCQGNYDSIPLTPIDGGVGAVLTENQLAFGGVQYPYDLQLVGTQGDVRKHTNVIQVYIGESLSGTGTWPTIPSEFTALEARMRDIAAHPPIPGENGCWQLWDPDTGEYADSRFPLPEGGGGSGADGGYYTPSVTQPDANTMRVSYEPSKTSMAAVPDVDLTLPAGQPGKDGAPGTDGSDGIDGGYYTPSVDAKGNLTWTASKAEMPEAAGTNLLGPQGPAGPQGPKGDTGPTGPQGPAGAVPNLQIGAVETLPAGSPATAGITGTPENPLLNLGIPQGADGSGSGKPTVIFDSGEITEEVNLIGPIDISQFSKVRILGKAYPSANSAGKRAAQIYFGNINKRLLCNAGSGKLFDTTGNPVSFLIYLDIGANGLSTHSYSGLNASNTFNDVDYAVSSGAATSDGGCLVYSTTYDLTQMYLSAQDDLSSRPWGVGTRIMVIGDA